MMVFALCPLDHQLPLKLFIGGISQNFNHCVFEMVLLGLLYCILFVCMVLGISFVLLKQYAFLVKWNGQL